MNARKPIFALLFMSIGVGAAFASQLDWNNGSSSSPDGVMATLNGQPINRSEVMDAAADRLAAVDLKARQQAIEIERNRHRALEDSIDEIVLQRVLSEKASSAGMTAVEYRQAELERLKAVVSDETVIQAYEQVRARDPERTLEVMSDEIRTYFAESQVDDAITQGADVQIDLAPFRILAVADSIDGLPSLGPDDAPITLVEFSDFQCPYCSRVNPTIEKIAEQYPDKVRIVFRQFPLDQLHPNARTAAEASLCANRQGEFWPLHDKMFSVQRELTPELIKQKVVELGLDERKFGECMAFGDTKAQVARDIEVGQLAGVTGTPALFINGRPLMGAVPFETAAALIDDEIERITVQ